MFIKVAYPETFHIEWVFLPCHTNDFNNLFNFGMMAIEYCKSMRLYNLPSPIFPLINNNNN